MVLWYDMPGGAHFMDKLLDHYVGSEGFVFDKAAKAIAALATTNVQRLVVGTETSDSDGLDYIPQLVDMGLGDRLIVITQREDMRALAHLRRFPVEAVLDGALAGEELTRALNSRSPRLPYVSPSLQPRLLQATADYRSQPLNPEQRFMLALFGAGFDDDSLAAALGQTPGEIRNRREGIRRKLGLGGRANLMHYAAYHGYVRSTGRIFIFPGYQRKLFEILDRTRETLPTLGCVHPAEPLPMISEITPPLH